MDGRVALDRAELLASLRTFARPAPRRTARDLALAWVISLSALVGMRAAIDSGAWLALVPLELVYGLAAIKLFLIQHDASHGCAWDGRAGNAVTALLAGVPSNTTPSVWKRDHDRHHAHSNDLDHPQDGQTSAWTTATFDAAPWPLAAAYAVGNAPLLLFTVGPIVLFYGRMRLLARWHENLAQAAFWYALYTQGLLGVHLAAFWGVGAFGFLVFHAQHTFPGVYKARGDAWDRVTNGLRGSSHLVLPPAGPLDPIVRWAFHGVGYHHLHHLNPAIPGDALEACQRQSGPRLAGVPVVTLSGALRTAGWSLYDEESGTFDVALRRLMRGRRG